MIFLQRLSMLVVVLCLAATGAVSADQTDRRLDDLFTRLGATPDPVEAIEIESAIWELWYQSGDEMVDEMMSRAAAMVTAGDLAEAEAAYTEIIEQAPDFSEGWNRRATVRYYIGDHDGSLADIEATLRLEPRHFGAIWGLGMILGARGDFERAILAFERLLEIKPGASDARPRIEMLRRALTEQSI